MPLAGRVAGRVLLDLLALPERGFRRQDVFAWLRRAVLRTTGRWAPIAAWERLSREAGVVAGRDEWDERLTRSPTSRRRRDAAPIPNSRSGGAERDRQQAPTRAPATAPSSLELIDDLAGRRIATAPMGEHAAWARGELTALVGAANRATAGPTASARPPNGSRSRSTGSPRSTRSKAR